MLIIVSALGQDVMVRRTPEPYKMLGLWSTDVNANGELMAVGGDDREIRIMYKGTHMFSTTFRTKGVVKYLRWHPTETRFLAFVAAGLVYVLDAGTGTVYHMPGATSAVSVAWNHDGHLLAAAGSDGVINLWDIQTGNLARTIPKDKESSFTSLDWHPTKNILVAAGNDIRILDTAGTVYNVIKHRKETAPVSSVRWHPSGDFFASADRGDAKAGIPSLIQLWGEEGELLKALPGAKAGYQGIAWDKEGNHLASVSDALRVWSSIGRLLHTGKSPDELWGLDWDRASGDIVTSSKRGRVRIWTAEAKLLKEFMY